MQSSLQGMVLRMKHRFYNSNAQNEIQSVPSISIIQRRYVAFSADVMAAFVTRAFIISISLSLCGTTLVLLAARNDLSSRRI